VSLVLDASLAAAWCFADKATDSSDRLLDRVAQEGAVVPSHFVIELANVLLTAERRGRITEIDAQNQITFLEGLSLIQDEHTIARAWSDTLQIARHSRLTAYDATYLELALRTGSTLLTLDQPQAAAARRLRLTVLP
jgi:predicted nucleic acid-binding protein